MLQKTYLKNKFKIFIGIFVLSGLLLIKSSFATESHNNETHEVSTEKVEEEKTQLHNEEHSESPKHENHEVHGHAESVQLLTPAISDIAKLPLLIIFLPMLGSLLYLLAAKQSYAIRNTIIVGTTGIVLVLMTYLYKYIVPGVYIDGHLYKGIQYTAQFIPGFNFSIKIDPAGYAIAMVSAFLWLVASIYSIDYMTIEKKINRFNFFTLFTLSAQLGVLLAGDFLTLFLFFEALVIFPYSMVVHHEDKEALSGANIFLYMSVATGLFLLMGIVLLWYTTGSIEIKAMGDLLNAAEPGWLKYAVIFFLVFGFGGKAGLFFEHAWLPRAHPVAPTPGSALLSGLMIKCGAYGIFRSINLLFSPSSLSVPDWINMANIGYVIIWVGILTMFLGVVNALLSENSKRMLAYHSVSQMGYIIMGVGCAAYLGKDGAMGLAGAIYHIINHALFKALLFMGVGAVYFRTHELNMYKLGGLWRNMPIVAFGTLIAACGIAGIPGFNGFASKTLLHHSILEAYEHSVHYSSNGKPDFMLRVAEIIFMITAGGTFASNIKMVILTFFGKRDKKFEKVKDVGWPMKISIIMLSGAIIFIGLYPNWILETVIGPALAYFNFDPTSHPYHVLYNTHAIGNALRSTIPILYEPATRAMFTSSEVIHNILGGSNAILLGGVIFILGFRMGWFHMPDSEWLTVEFYYKKIYGSFKQFCTGMLVEVSNEVTKGEVTAFRKNYDEFVKICKGPVPDIENMSGVATEFNSGIQKGSLSVSKVSDWITEKEINFFSKNYDSFTRFLQKTFPDTPDVQSGFGDGAVVEDYHWFTSLFRNTIGKVYYHLTRLVMFLMVDIWLATSHSRSVYKRFDDAFISWYGGDLVVDKKFADTYLNICKQASNFDYNFIDGMVNGFAWFILTYGRTLRRIQTGYIQNYALSIILGVVIMVTACLFIF